MLKVIPDCCRDRRISSLSCMAAREEPARSMSTASRKSLASPEESSPPQPRCGFAAPAESPRSQPASVTSLCLTDCSAIKNAAHLRVF